MRREQQRSTVSMLSTSWQLLQLVAHLDRELKHVFGHAGAVDDQLLERVLYWTLSQTLEPYQPAMMCTEI